MPNKNTSAVWLILNLLLTVFQKRLYRGINYLPSYGATLVT